MKQIILIGFISKNPRAICLAASVLVMILFSLRSIQEAYFTLPSFDGAINLQVPENLIKYGRYATSYNTLIDFYQGIQSGSPLLFPIYLMFLVFGKSVFSAQLISSMYLILAAAVTYYLTSLYANRFFALVCLLLFILTPCLLEFGHHIYGEIPALFYLLLSLATLNNLEKNPDGLGFFLAFLTGFLYGLSCLTKTVMLIAVPSVIFFSMIDLFFIHRLRMKHYVLMFIGFILPLAAFECYKIIQLGTDVYSGWWEKQSYSIMSQAGVKKNFQDTANVYAKMLAHTRKFYYFLRMNTAIMVIFLCIPPIAFIIKFSYHCINNTREKINVTLAILYGTAFTYMVWWIFITPTAKAWARRIISGYILEEIVFVISLYWLWKYVSSSRFTVHSLQKIAACVVFTVMLLIVLYQGAVNMKNMKFLFGNSHEKLDAERIAKTIEMLPEKAKIYGAGWWQAPILSFLSNRTFLDLLQHTLPTYPVKLEDTYFVIDYPDALEHVSFSVLNKTKNRLIERQGYNYLYQIEYISDYSYTNSYRENRNNAIVWLARHVMPSDKVVIAKEIGIYEYELKLQEMYFFAWSEAFRKIRKDDLINVDDAHILRRLQRSPEFVYEEPLLVFRFFETNKLKIKWPEIIIKEGREITEKWVADNSVAYAVGYDNIVVQDNAPFYDPLFRQSLKAFPLAQIKPKISFQRRGSWGSMLDKEPKVNIYKFK